MAELVTLQDSFHAGVKRDFARDQLPKGSLWWAEDMLPNVGARLRERGGWTNYSNDIAATTATASYATVGVYASYSDSPQTVALDEDGRVYKIASNGTVTDLGAADTSALYQNPVFHRDKVIIPGSTPKKVTNAAGTLTLASLAGSPPASLFASVFNDRTLLAANSVNDNRLWFSDAGDPEGWDTTNSYWDFSQPITGLASLKTAILVFHESYVSRLRGSTPPPSGDFFADDPMWSVGCTDANSIAYWNDRVVFANAEGIYLTDGAGVDDLTARCGMTSYWQETLASYTSLFSPSTAGTWTIAGGVLRDHYVVSVMDGSTVKASAMIDLRRLAYWPMTNIDARGMWVGQGSVDELYWGRRGAARVAKMSPVLTPSSTVKNDGDGDAVAGLVETPFYRGKPSVKGWRRLFTTHYLADYATDNPTVSVGYITTPEDTSYTSIGTLSELSAEDRKPQSLGFSGRGIALQYSRANAGDWRLNHIEADVNQREGSR